MKLTRRAVLLAQETALTPRADLANVLEAEVVARRRLAPDVFSMIAGGDRSFFERITFRPRMMVNTTALDLSVELFGEKLFAPILVGPAARQQMFHAEGELAMVRGAAAAKTLVVVSGDSSFPIEKIAAEAKTILWYQVFPDADANAVRGRAQQAVKAGCKAVCVTVGANGRGVAHLSWNMIDQIRRGLGVPVVLKGVMTAEDAKEAVKRGIEGMIVSNYGGLLSKGLVSPMEMLPSITDAVGGKVPVLVDGGFRRGSDILKALAFGARAVLVSRPALWGLAAYGADGVQTVLEMLQTELGRSASQCGKVNVKAIDRSVVKVHRA
jgi:isopentenyl diphosphate isomerase/L-lactate dehydrogenase-like FMN-dependent dehydrogenase